MESIIEIQERILAEMGVQVIRDERIPPFVVACVFKGADGVIYCAYNPASGDVVSAINEIIRKLTFGRWW